MRHESAVGVHPLLDIGQIAALDDAVEPFGAADEESGYELRVLSTPREPKAKRAAVLLRSSFAYAAAALFVHCLFVGDEASECWALLC